MASEWPYFEPGARGLRKECKQRSKRKVARLNLQAIVEKYLAIAGAFGRPAALASFGLDRAEVERVFGALDEDYQISRYFHFTCDSGSRFRINDFEQTHISIDAKIRDIL